ncbi:hypothetical protein BA896_012200 [Janthinobacterium lividum]|uniref:Uncharacterized protein n=1 Tax=Janthinobacterium lividum TaxID=29581 RepID=A0A1E8PTF5_9BURK|nr:hypothetical protein BA896_012200 [Janthinobacterium lividum]
MLPLRAQNAQTEQRLALLKKMHSQLYGEGKIESQRELLTTLRGMHANSLNIYKYPLTDGYLWPIASLTLTD